VGPPRKGKEGGEGKRTEGREGGEGRGGNPGMLKSRVGKPTGQSTLAVNNTNGRSTEIPFGTIKLSVWLYTVMLILVLVLKDSLRTKFKSLSL